MGESKDERTSSKAAGAAGTAAAAGAGVAGAQSFLFGDEAEALDLEGQDDRVAPALDLGAHDVVADDEFGEDDLADDVDALLDDDPLLGTADVLDQEPVDDLDALDGIDDLDALDDDIDVMGADDDPGDGDLDAAAHDGGADDLADGDLSGLG